MIDWIKTWTFFNWLTLIAFLLALVGFLNSFLSLKSRYQDWRATKSKKEFEKRVITLLKVARQVTLYRNSPEIYYLVVIKILAYTIFSSLSAFFMFVWAVILIASGISLIAIPVLLICQLIIVVALRSAFKFIDLHLKVYTPTKFGKEIQFFINRGAGKGLITSEQEISLLKELVNSDVLEDFAARELKGSLKLTN
jgi:hypothetical protein